MRNSWNWLVKRFVTSSNSVVSESVVRSGEKDIQHEYLIISKYVKSNDLCGNYWNIYAPKFVGDSSFFLNWSQCTIFHSQSFNKFFSYEFQLARLKVAKMSHVKWASTFWIRSLTLPAICQDIVSAFLCINWPWGKNIF